MVRQNSQVDVCVILLLTLLVTASGDDNDSPTALSQNTPTGSSSMGLGLSFNGLQRLGCDCVYAGKDPGGRQSRLDGHASRVSFRWQLESSRLSRR